MRDLRLEDFTARTGTEFAVEANGVAARLVLEEAAPLGTSIRAGGSFSLTFRGPVEPVLPQACYGFDLDGERVDIFVVPISQERDGTRYQAIFN